MISSSDDTTLDDVAFDEFESVDQYEATFTGTLDGEEVTVTYTLESAISADERGTVYSPGDDELERVIVQPDTYEFETADQDTGRFTATDDDGEDLLLVYVFTEAEDADENEVSLDVNADV